MMLFNCQGASAFETVRILKGTPVACVPYQCVRRESTPTYIMDQDGLRKLFKRPALIKLHSITFVLCVFWGELHFPPEI